MEQLPITQRISIPYREIDFSYARSGGPGGQNVNKVETKVVARFDLAQSPSIPESTRRRVLRSLASRLTKRGELVIHSDRYRDRERNRADALERLAATLRKAIIRPRRRVATKPSRAHKEKRLSDKRHRGKRKFERSRVNPDD